MYVEGVGTALYSHVYCTTEPVLGMVHVVSTGISIIPVVGIHISIQ